MSHRRPRKIISHSLPHPLGEQWRYSRSPSPSLGLCNPVQPPRKKNDGKQSATSPLAPKTSLVGNRPITAAKNQKGPARRNPTLQDKITVLDFMQEKGWSQIEVIKHFKPQFPSLSQSTLSRWKKHEEGLREQAKDKAKLSFKRVTQVEFPEVERALAAWVLQTEAQQPHFRVTDEVLRTKARHFAGMLGIPSDSFLRCSNGWVHKFKIRQQIKCFRHYGEAAAVASEDVEVARQHFQEISKGYNTKDIYNLDESGLYYRMPPDRGLASKQMSGTKKDKTRISLVFIVNADGSHCLPVNIIGHAKCPRPFNKKSGKELGFEYYWNKKAWMTGSIFQLVLEYINTVMRRRGQSILLYIDNAPSHTFDPSKLPNLKVVFLTPNMTSHIQPLDAGIIRVFKAHYRRLHILRALLRVEAGFDDIYAIDQLEAMQMVEEAWACITKETVSNCWKHAGILSSPDDNNNSNNNSNVAHSSTVDAPIQELAAAVERLSLSGVIASRNVPSVEDLLDITDEQITEAIWTDEEIVQQAYLEQQVEDGEDGEETETEEDTIPLLSNGAACQAISELIRLCNQRNEEVFSAARASLLSLGLQLRTERSAAMKQSEITQFFTSNSS